MKKNRVMWLLNHTMARKFEVAMLKRIGFDEIFLPKIYANFAESRSFSIDDSEDKNLAIPAEDLAILNATDWYNAPSQEAWDVANKHFNVMFFIMLKGEIIEAVTKNFKGAIIWRAFGLDISTDYSSLVQRATANRGKGYLQSCGDRFWFGEAYDHLHDIEEPFISDRAVFLPLGLHDCSMKGEWTGTDKRIYFVCPQISTNSYYKAIYQKFAKDFAKFPYVVAGAQSEPIADKRVLGFVSPEEHSANIRNASLMFYHSQEPNHIHYHPFEAIRAGLPLIFMSGGILDRMGGIGQPGRCTSIWRARRKIRRILKGDTAFIESIRTQQQRMLDPMRPENCEPAWRSGFEKILKSIA